MSSTIDNTPNPNEKLEKEATSRIPYLKKKRSGSKTMADTNSKPSIKDTFKERLRRFSTKKNQQETAKVAAIQMHVDAKEVASTTAPSAAINDEATKNSDSSKLVSSTAGPVEPSEEYN
jgi:hypothetical protein